MTAKRHRDADPVRSYRVIPEIDIYPDYVIICGQIVRRPSYVSPLQWLTFWEQA
jgi:hypothetical protein